MAKIDELKNAVNRLLFLKGEIEKYNQLLLHHNDISDVRNYDSEKVDLIMDKVSKMQAEYCKLYDEWF